MKQSGAPWEGLISREQRPNGLQSCKPLLTLLPSFPEKREMNKKCVCPFGFLVSFVLNPETFISWGPADQLGIDCEVKKGEGTSSNFH